MLEVHENEDEHRQDEEVEGRVDSAVGWSRVDELGTVTSLEVHELLSRMRMKISETRR